MKARLAGGVEMGRAEAEAENGGTIGRTSDWGDVFESVAASAGTLPVDRVVFGRYGIAATASGPRTDYSQDSAYALWKSVLVERTTGCTRRGKLGSPHSHKA